jgi:hypothetical protein
MKYYSITGVLEGEHHHHIIQADKVGVALQLFRDVVARDEAASMGVDLTDEFIEGCLPWVVSVCRTTEKPEKIRVA